MFENKNLKDRNDFSFKRLNEILNNEKKLNDFMKSVKNKTKTKK